MNDTQNWIERRALRDKKLSRAVELWRDIVDAVFACASSFNKEYSRLGRMQTQNAEPKKVKVIFYRQAQVSGHEVPAQTNRVVSIDFEDANPAIRVTAGHAGPRLFEIKSEESRSFIRHNGQEISIDEFCRLALEDTLFESPKRKVQSAPH